MPGEILQNSHRSAQVIWPERKQSPRGLKGKAKQAPREVGANTGAPGCPDSPPQPGEPTWGQTETERQIRGPA